jgi:acyl carrier protein
MGRADSQVKVRGNRVELAEIEMALLDLDSVKDAAIVQQEDVRGEQGLVAYLVPASRPAPTVSALRRALTRALPDHMVPSAFVMLDALPLTPAGKVDRGALPRPARVRPELDDPFVAPRTPVERGVTEIWSDVLALDRVGVHDHFLDLGGDSLLAIQVISRVIRTFQVELPVRALFESPTVADMAVMIVQNQAKKAGQGDVERMLAELEALSSEEAKSRAAGGGS